MTEPIRIDVHPRPPQPSELRDFLLIVRRALLLIVAYIEKRYGT